MATKIIHKKSSVASSAPVAADIAPGELALNLADQKIYSKQTDGTIIEMGGGSSADKLPLSGGTLTGNVEFGSGNKAKFGASNQLEIYAGSGDAHIKESGSANFVISGNNLYLTNTDQTKRYFLGSGSTGKVTLYYASSEKFATTSTGATITGDIAVSGTVDGRDVATDGTKLDTIDTNADVTPSWVPSSDPSYLTSYTVTEADVTGHEAALSITESQISDLGSYLTSVPAQSFSSLTGKPTTISGYGITDAFDGAYGSLSGTPTIPANPAITTNGSTPSLASGITAAEVRSLIGAGTSSSNNATHTGDVTGSGALTIADNVVDAGNLKVTGNGSSTQFLRSDGDGSFTWAVPTDTNTTYSVGDGGLTEKNFTTADNTKLDGIAASATNTAAPAISTNGSTPSLASGITAAEVRSLIGAGTSSSNNATHTGEVTGSGALTIAADVVDAGNLKVTGNGTTAQFLRSDGDGSFTWATPVDTNTDTNTTYTAGTGMSLSGTTFNCTVVNTDTNTNQLTTFQLEDGDGTEVTVSHGKEVKFTEGQGINVNWTDTSTGSDGDPFDMQFALKANGVRANELNVSGNGTSSQFLRSDGDGSFTWATPTDTNTNTTYSAGTGMSLSGTTFNCNINTPGEVGLGNLSSSGNNLAGSFTATGNITAYSDERLKDNIETIDGALDKVCAMRGVMFDKDGQRETGVIAQEVQAVLPEAVLEGEYLSVAYGNLVGVLIESVKELKAEIEELKKGK